MRRATQTLLDARFLCLLIVGVSGGATVFAQPSGTFTRTGDMTAARSFHTATLLPDGRVVVAGGSTDSRSSLTSAELYDPRSGTFRPTGDMTTGRRGHTSTLLPDGRILLAGGYSGPGTPAASAELFDPSSGTFKATGAMETARVGHTAIVLSNGKVLVVGGYGTSGYPNVAAAELYDPLTGTFTAAGPYVGRGGCDFCAPATLLADGRVLFPGQYPAQLFDASSNSFSADGMPISDHSTATLLMNGKVLFAGGETFARSSRAELYEPATGTFISTGDMAWRRVWHGLTLLPNGMALATGGETESCTGNSCWFAGSTVSAELYDPSAGKFVRTADMAQARGVHTATLLKDGRVLIAGGVSYGGIGIFHGSLASAELYTPDVLVSAPVLVSVSGDGDGQGAIFHAGTSHVATPDDPAAAGDLLDISSTGLSHENVIPPQIAVGGRLAQVISFGAAPGISGVTLIRVRLPSGVAPGPAVPVRLTYLDRPSNQVTIAVK
jgi:hypothetical protein